MQGLRLPQSLHLLFDGRKIFKASAGKETT
jgi:hypothetical protein